LGWDKGNVTQKNVLEAFERTEKKDPSWVSFSIPIHIDSATGWKLPVTESSFVTVNADKDSHSITENVTDIRTDTRDFSQEPIIIPFSELLGKDSPSL
jgi:hypothetical protein